MRSAIPSMVALLLAAGSVSAQSLEIEIVQATDAGKLLITRTVRQQEQYTYTVQVPVSETTIQDGKEVTITRLVPQTRAAIRMVAMKTLTNLSESDANFTDLRGKPVPIADVKQRMGKNSLAVVVLKSDDPPPSDLILSVLRENTLILREPPAKAAPKTEAKGDPKP